MLRSTYSGSVLWCVAVVIVSAGALAGCSKSPFDLARVRGRVTIDGKPLAAGKVMFAPIAGGESREAGKPAFGALQQDGSFVLTTFQDGDGAVVGEHWVTIFGPEQESGVTQVSAPGLPKFKRLAVPQKRSVAGEQDNEIEVSLTSQDVARYGVL